MATSDVLDRQGVIVRGRPDESLLLQMVATDDSNEAPEMPKEGDPLSQGQISKLRAWITHGAPWPDGLVISQSAKADKSWWSLQPLSGGKAPVSDQIPPKWNEHPIDQFVFAKLAKKGLRPSPPADRGSLIRRATLDLIGLPPTPKQIDAFLNDPSPNAYQQLIERLLESPRYGERWGRHWLDVIRFGESSGYEVNHIRDNAWPFRDYVIRSFNQDKPFDRFVLEQLAGEVVGAGDPDVEVATGFLVAGSFDKVGNQDPLAQKVIRANTLDDIIATTGAAFLGLTVNCTRCHDHKFDPIKQLDYYRMQATFAGVQQQERTLATDQQKQNHARRRGPIEKQLAEVEQNLKQLIKLGNDRMGSRRDKLIDQLFPRESVSKLGTEETFEPRDTKYVRMTVHRSTDGGRAGANLDEFEVFRHGDGQHNVALAEYGSKASVRTSRYSNDDPDVYGAHNLNDGKYSAFWISDEPGGQLTIEFPQVETISRVVWSVDRIRSFGPRSGRPFTAEYDIEISLDGKSWTKVADHQGRRPFDDSRLNERLLLNVLTDEEINEREDLLARKSQLRKQLSAIGPLPTAWIGQFQQPAEATYLMKGGDPMRRGPDVAPASMSMLDEVTLGYELPLDARESERRLALARWITHPDNPLTPRVLANRIWQYHFGQGIVATPSDFGYNGGRPSHPRLLDWLARQVQHHGWRWKPIHKLIMTSQTYQQSSRYNESMASRDADAVYLWRFPPQRLTAEAVRDSILMIVGKLDLTMGGPGFRLYNYTVDNVATYYPLDHVGPETYRRAVYHQNPRSVRVDVLGQYDLPDCGLPAPRRVVTTSPLQALALQNHSFMMDMAQFFAQRLQREIETAGVEAQVARAFRLALGRSPEADELAAATQLIDKNGLTIFCRALLNANELIYVH